MDGVWGAEVGVCWSVVTNLCAGVERMGERLFHGSDGLGRRGEEDGLASEGGTRPGRLMWPSYFILQLCFALEEKRLLLVARDRERGHAELSESRVRWVMVPVYS